MKTFLLGLALMLLSYGAAAQTPQRAIWNIRTQDSVGIDEAVPMIGQYPAPKAYHRWWNEIAECEGLVVPNDSIVDLITFFEVNAGSFEYNDNRDYAVLGVSVPQEGLMYLSIAQLWNEQTVKHEFLHFQLYFVFKGTYNQSNADHPKEFFNRCGMTATN